MSETRALIKKMIRKKMEMELFCELCVLKESKINEMRRKKTRKSFPDVNDDGELASKIIQEEEDSAVVNFNEQF